MAVKYSSLPFKEQIAFWQGKDLVPTERWNDLTRAEHDIGFMVAGATKADLLADLHSAVDKAITKGTTLEEFRRDFDKLVEKHGWVYNGPFGKKIDLRGKTSVTAQEWEDYQKARAWRTRVIYDTNLQASYQAGRYAQLTNPDLLKSRPNWKYKHSDFVAHPRELHKSWNNVVLPWNHPWWKTHFAPNGWLCHCYVVPVSADEYKGNPAPDDGTYEWTDKKTGEVHTFPNGIDPFFDYAPGASRVDFICQQMLRKAEGLPPTIGNQLKDFINQPALIKSSQTTANAEKLAESLGVQAVDFNNNVSIASQVIPALQHLSDKDLSMPDKLIVNLKVFEDWAVKFNQSVTESAAVFVPPKNLNGASILFLNPVYSQWENMAKDAKVQFDKGYWSTADKHHLIWHESGHLNHYRNSPQLYLQLYGKLFNNADRLIAEKVSLYAAQTKLEFVAEVFAGLLAGREFDDDTMKLYQSLGGKKL